MITSKAKTISKALHVQLKQDGDIIERFPLQHYIDYLNAYPIVQDYKVASLEVNTYCNHILTASDTTTLNNYHKVLLCGLITLAVDKLKTENLPPIIKDLYEQNFNWILEDIVNEDSEGEYLYPSDKLFKNMAICCLRLIPVGARKINLSVLPIKNFMFNKGLRQFLDLAFYIITELRGIRPLYIGHLDTNDPNLVKELNPEGLKNTYLRIAELLKINKKVKGYFGTSWLLDPQLDAINLRHQYARRLVTDNGGKLYYKGPSESALKNSLAKSQTRNKLYEEKKYIPTDYVIVWSRHKLIKWAEKVRSS